MAIDRGANDDGGDAARLLRMIPITLLTKRHDSQEREAEMFARADRYMATAIAESRKRGGSKPGVGLTEKSDRDMGEGRQLLHVGNQRLFRERDRLEWHTVLHVLA